MPSEMINRTAYRDLPDWSQIATKQDLATLQSDLRSEMKDLQATLIRWMVGLFLTFTAVLGALLTSSNLLG